MVHTAGTLLAAHCTHKAVNCATRWQCHDGGTLQSGLHARHLPARRHHPARTARSAGPGCRRRLAPHASTCAAAARPPELPALRSPHHCGTARVAAVLERVEREGCTAFAMQDCYCCWRLHSPKPLFRGCGWRRSLCSAKGVERGEGQRGCRLRCCVYFCLGGWQHTKRAMGGHRSTAQCL